MEVIGWRTKKVSDEVENLIKPVEMVDVSQKLVIARRAEAMGVIRLQPQTIDVIRLGQVTKGNVLATAEIAGILSAKRTPEIIPLCHQIPLSQITLSFEMAKDNITARCNVSANYKTGVEMEALVGVTTSLLTIWDMVKYLEKDAGGQYPHTRIQNVQVTEKWKDE
jgi:cyclic pyranopterin phosphate synthase